MNGGVIARYASSDELCKKTMDIFVTVSKHVHSCRHHTYLLTLTVNVQAYGSEAGVAGLKWLPYGGLYLTGGLTPKNIHLLTGEHGLFMTAFRDKGRVSGMLNPIPVYAVMAEDLGQRSVTYSLCQQHI